MMVTFYGRGMEICDARTSVVIVKVNVDGGNFVIDVLKMLVEKFVFLREISICDVVLLKGERWMYVDGSTLKGKVIVYRSSFIDENEW